jgi:heat shock protein HspQ
MRNWVNTDKTSPILVKAMTTVNAKFAVGQVVLHKLFDYRGVIIDVDSHFRGDQSWYDTVALSRPPKDLPWYHVLVDGADQRTYVAERNMEADETAAPVRHKDIGLYFEGFDENGYVILKKHN